MTTPIGGDPDEDRLSGQGPREADLDVTALPTLDSPWRNSLAARGSQETSLDLITPLLARGPGLGGLAATAPPRGRRGTYYTTPRGDKERPNGRTPCSWGPDELTKTYNRARTRQSRRGSLAIRGPG